MAFVLPEHIAIPTTQTELLARKKEKMDIGRELQPLPTKKCHKST